MLDWDRIRVFRGVAQAGSFTRAAELLGLSQSAISRQIGALEEDLGMPLFHRHARGLVLTEQGEVLLEAAHDVAARMATAQSKLAETKDTPSGHLRINTTVGFGTVWLTSHLREFVELYPDITVSVLAIDTELDLSMREADVAIRLTPPRQPDLVQRRLMTAHTHLYAAHTYLDDAPPLREPADLDRHRLIAYGTEATPPPVPSLNWVLVAGRGDAPRAARRLAHDQQRLRHVPGGRARPGRGFPARLPVLHVDPAGARPARPRGAELRCVLRLSGGNAGFQARPSVPRLPAAQDPGATGVVNRQQRCDNAWQTCTQGLALTVIGDYVVHCSKGRASCADLLKWVGRFP